MTQSDPVKADRVVGRSSPRSRKTAHPQPARVRIRAFSFHLAGEAHRTGSSRVTTKEAGNMGRNLPDLEVVGPVTGEKVTITFHADGKQYDLPVLGGHL